MSGLERGASVVNGGFRFYGDYGTELVCGGLAGRENAPVLPADDFTELIISVDEIRRTMHRLGLLKEEVTGSENAQT